MKKPLETLLLLAMAAGLAMAPATALAPSDHASVQSRPQDQQVPIKDRVADQGLIAAKYSAGLKKIFDLEERFAPLHPALRKVYPVAIVEGKTFYIFEPVPAERTYRLVEASPDTFNIPAGIRAAMPLSFWGNRMACVVTGEVFGQPDGYVFIFHEFVHCAQWECCEQKLKQGMPLYQEAMKAKNYMWELQHPFPYADPVFVKVYAALFKAWDADDAAAAESELTTLRKALSPDNWDYLTWQEWKEGLARHLENRMRAVLGLPENKGGEDPPFSRVTFYRGGDKLIRFLERRQPGIVNDMEGLYRTISAGPKMPEAPAELRAAR